MTITCIFWDVTQRRFAQFLIPLSIFLETFDVLNWIDFYVGIWELIIRYYLSIKKLCMKMWNINLLFNLISSLQFEIQFLWFIGQVFLSICIKYGWFRHYFAWGLSSGSFASIFLRRSIQSPDNFLNLWCAKLIWHSLFYLRTFL